MGFSAWARTLLLGSALLVGCTPDGSADDDTDPGDDDSVGIVDTDNDGSPADLDCDDADPGRFPGRPEACDGVDNDCSGSPGADEADADLDLSMLCEGDCDDDNESTHPGATEGCDGSDNDCQGGVPADENDGDTDGHLICEGDCEDGMPDVHPGHAEDCDGSDNDCQGGIPTDEADADSDGHRQCAGDCDDDDALIYPGQTMGEGCDGVDSDCDGAPGDAEIDTDGDGQSICSGDCDPLDPAIFPGNTEICDGVHNDCAGSFPTDEYDNDADGAMPCEGDCDDLNVEISPLLPDLCDGIDTDCSGALSDDELDDDGDGSTECDGDCDDGEADTFPLNAEVNDGIDNDCDALVDGADPDNGLSELAQGMNFALLPPGSFEMGCTAAQAAFVAGGCPFAELPVHTVTLTRTIEFARTEVTQPQFEALMGYNPASYAETSSFGCSPNCPVEMVSWYEAAAFANAVSVAEGLTPCYQCSGPQAAVTCNPPSDPYACEGYRLPTEAEWEYAARAGTDLVYAGANAPDLHAWYTTNSGGMPHTVAQKSANAFGLYDLSGNVTEWIHDAYSPYASGPVTDPLGSSLEAQVRGGGFLGSDYFLRVSYRWSAGLAWGDRSAQRGFRLVRTDAP